MIATPKDTLFSQRNDVVFHENNFQTISNDWISVYDCNGNRMIITQGRILPILHLQLSGERKTKLGMPMTATLYMAEEKKRKGGESTN